MLLRSLSLFSYRDYEFRFNPELPFIKQETKYYYRNIFYKRAESHLEDVKYCSLQVGLIPAPEPQHSGHQIRIRTHDNPSWYSELYQSFSKERVRKTEELSGNQQLKDKGLKKHLRELLNMILLHILMILY